MIDIVIQQEETGCGLASVAMLAGRSYQDVKKQANSLGIYAEDKSLWSNTAYVRRLLKCYGINALTVETPFKSWESLPNCALLAIKYHEEGGQFFWHWTVFERDDKGPVVLDPAAYLENNYRREFSDIQPKWFIEITLSE
jgi:ABC-type bacteriocin/lantibiotic exporter with double-glycine peptidase domain